MMIANQALLTWQLRSCCNSRVPQAGSLSVRRVIVDRARRFWTEANKENEVRVSFVFFF